MSAARVPGRESLPGAVRPARAAMDRAWRDEGWHRGETLASVLAAAARFRGEVPITFHSRTRDTEVLRLADMHERGLRVAAALHALGLRAGDVIAVQLPNWAELAVAYAAAAALGLVFVPVVPIYGPSELGTIVSAGGVSALVLASQWRGASAAAVTAEVGALPSLEHVVVVGEDAPQGTLRWADLEAHAVDGPGPVDIDPDDVCLVLFTSGTTAVPKGVQHSHHSLVAELRGSPTPPQDRQGTVSLQPFPPGHTAGLAALLGTSVHGIPTVLMDHWDAHDAVSLVVEHQVTAVAGTPFFLSGILDAAEDESRDVSTVRDVITGGAGVPPVLIERADRHGWCVCRCYGLTEQPSLTAASRGDSLERRLSGDGRPIAGNRVRIRDELGADVPPGIDGEITAIGPEQCVSYIDPADNRESFTDDGWLRTGDIGHLDSDGFVVVTDRRKDIIIRGGENISSKEVEDVLAGHPAVAEAAVTGIPDARYGERVGAFVVLRPGAALDLLAVQQLFATSGLARQKTPERLVITPALPRTAAGKVKKYELRQGFLHGE